MPSSSPTRLRTTATVVGTLLVVLVEMALLTAVWHLGDGLDRQREATAALRGALTTVSAPATVADVAAVRTAVDAVVRSGAEDHGAVAPLIAATDRLTAAPADSGALEAVRTATGHLAADLDGARTWLAATAAAMHAGLLAVASVGWFVWFRRIVDRHRSLERRLTAQRVVDRGERRLLELVRNSADLIVVVEPDGALSFVSPSTRSVLGRDPEPLVGATLAHLLGDAGHSVARVMDSGRPGAHSVSAPVTHTDGRRLVLEGTFTNLVHEEAVSAWVLALHDVTAQHALADQLSHQAFHDPLTGLANRALFADRLAHALQPRGDAAPTTVLFLDLDDFKNVNDTQGHSVGDRLLVVVADRLRGALRPSDTAARLGGDEFAVILEQADGRAAHRLAERILGALSTPIEVEGTVWVVHGSIGIATACPGETTTEDMLRNADVAMYWAKEDGKNTIACYDDARHTASLDRRALQHELARAIDENELLLLFQPTVELETGVVSGFEALVRWEHPERGLLAPSEFIPLAERTGLVVPLGSWVLREACRAGATMDLERAPTVAVNVSAKQLLRPGFAEEVATVLRETGMPPRRLVLEMTESVLLDDFAGAQRTLNRIRELGVWIAIDDFGTGYSSLSYLSQLPVDILKVDKSFIDRVTTEDHAASVTLAILEMSRNLQLVTVAEGVETDAQAAWLRARSCGRGQGYLWSRPVPLADARAMLVAPDGDLSDPRTPVA